MDSLRSAVQLDQIIGNINTMHSTFAKINSKINILINNKNIEIPALNNTSTNNNNNAQTQAISTNTVNTAPRAPGQRPPGFCAMLEKYRSAYPHIVRPVSVNNPAVNINLDISVVSVLCIPAIQLSHGISAEHTLSVTAHVVSVWGEIMPFLSLCNKQASAPKEEPEHSAAPPSQADGTFQACHPAVRIPVLLGEPPPTFTCIGISADPARTYSPAPHCFFYVQVAGICFPFVSSLQASRARFIVFHVHVFLAVSTMPL
jgi:hypothetical protein